MSSCLHCNNCGLLPSAVNCSFGLSNCGHVYCKECIDAGRLSVKCSSCGAEAPKFIAIDRNLPPNLQVVFKKPAQLLSELKQELDALVKFQDTQYTMRSAGKDAQIRDERRRIADLEREKMALLEAMRKMDIQCPGSSRPHNSSSRSAGGNSSHSHTMSSSVASKDQSSHHHHRNPFQTPVSGTKRFTNSKVHQSTIDSSRPRNTTQSSGMTPRIPHSSLAPSSSLSSFSQAFGNDDFMNVTAESRAGTQNTTLQMLHVQQHTPLQRPANGKMTIDYSPILTGAAKTPVPKAPARTAKTPQKGQLQPGGPATSTPKMARETQPVVTPHPRLPSPIEPINGSQLRFPKKESERPSAPAFRTPAIPVKKTTAMPRTMPAGRKTGMGGSGGVSTSRPHL